MKDNYYFKRVYYGYSVREARRAFREELEAGKD
jgi:hypothetical protein